jgi:peptide/nickel transport system permease protein
MKFVSWTVFPISRATKERARLEPDDIRTRPSRNHHLGPQQGTILTAYIARRLLGLIPVLLGISLLVFSFVRLIPGDPALTMLGERATPESRAALRKLLGLDSPWFFNPQAVQKTGNPLDFFDGQYFRFVGSLARGDFGSSIFSQIPVSEELKRRWPATLELSIAAMLFAILVGVMIGVLAALRRNSVVDNASMAVALIGVSMPIFWLGMILKYAFSVYTQVLPPSSRLSDALSITFTPVTGLYVLDGILRGQPGASWDALLHLVMPAVALGTIPMAVIARMTRSAMVEVLAQDYVRTARAKGLQQRAVVMKHALRNAMLPVITVVGLSFGGLLSGAILTETIFSWSGIGSWIYEGILQRDYPIVQGGVLIVAFVFVLVNLLVDLSYALFDPRIQYR